MTAKAVKHGLENLRHSRHHVNIAERKTGGFRNRIVDQCCAIRDAGHPQTGGVQLDPGICIIGGQNSARILPHIDPHTEGRGHAICGDIVMVGPMPPDVKTCVYVARSAFRAVTMCASTSARPDLPKVNPMLG